MAPPNWRKEYSRYRVLFAKLLETYRQKQSLRVFLELILTLTTISVFSLFALKPTVITIVQLLKDIKTKETTIEQMDTKIKALSTAQSLFSKETRRISLVTKAVPVTALPENVIRQFEGIAQKNGVELVGVSVSELTLLGKEMERKSSSKKETLPEGAEGVVFSANTSADFSALLPFLKDVEQFLRPVALDSFSISVSTKEDAKTINMMILGKVPFLEKENEK